AKGIGRTHGPRWDGFGQSGPFRVSSKRAIAPARSKQTIRLSFTGETRPSSYLRGPHNKPPLHFKVAQLWAWATACFWLISAAPAWTAVHIDRGMIEQAAGGPIYLSEDGGLYVLDENMRSSETAFVVAAAG